MTCPHCHGTGTITLPDKAGEVLDGVSCPWCAMESARRRGEPIPLLEILRVEAHRRAQEEGRQVDEESFEMWRKYLEEEVRSTVVQGAPVGSDDFSAIISAVARACARCSACGGALMTEGMSICGVDDDVTSIGIGMKCLDCGGLVGFDARTEPRKK